MLEVLTSGATVSFPPSDLSFFSGGCSDIFTLFSLFLLLEPGGLPGPLLTGPVPLVGTLLSSFSDLRLSGAESIMYEYLVWNVERKTNLIILYC